MSVLTEKRNLPVAVALGLAAFLAALAPAEAQGIKLTEVTGYQFALKNNTDKRLTVVLRRADREFTRTLKPGEVFKSGPALLLAEGDRAILVFDAKTDDLLLTGKHKIAGPYCLRLDADTGGKCAMTAEKYNPERGGSAETDIK